MLQLWRERLYSVPIVRILLCSAYTRSRSLEVIHAVIPQGFNLLTTRLFCLCFLWSPYGPISSAGGCSTPSCSATLDLSNSALFWRTLEVGWAALCTPTANQHHNIEPIYTKNKQHLLLFARFYINTHREMHSNAYCTVHPCCMYKFSGC